MKNYILFACCFMLMTCSKKSDDNNCRFLLNLAVSANINMNLPQYSQLQFTSNSVYIGNQGNAGVIVTNVGNGWRAWDASDPNHSPNECSLLSINGGDAECGCADANAYSLFTGEPLGTTGLRCGLKEYRVDVSGNTLVISN